VGACSVGLTCQTGVVGVASVVGSSAILGRTSVTATVEIRVYSWICLVGLFIVSELDATNG
jgi:hypothetical protein